MPKRNEDLISLARGIREDAIDASRDMRRYFGLEYDPDVRLYERMGYSDFMDLTNTFGEEVLGKYVREMEFKRLARR
jgi:hypothetical protein